MKSVLEQMKELQVSMGGEIQNVELLKVQILERKIQVLGELLEYNPLEDKNIPRVSDVFMCVDQIGKFSFMFNIVDKAQKTSYTTKEFKDLNDFEISVKDQSVNFIGNPRKNHYIPGYIFKVKTLPDFKNLKLVLTRCIYEAQNKISAEKAEDFDTDFLGSQLQGDFSSSEAKDIKMADDDDYFFESETVQAKSGYRDQAEHRELHKLLACLDASVIMEDPNEDSQTQYSHGSKSPATQSKHKADRQGLYNYYDDSDNENQ